MIVHRPVRVAWLLLVLAVAACAARAPASRTDAAPGDAPRPAVDSTTIERPAIVIDSSDVALSVPRVLATAKGEATYYSDRLAGRTTASGVPYRPDELVAAHRSYPFGTVVRVTNLRNERVVVVRIVDRGPWGETARVRRTIIDVSRRAAETLDFLRDGRIPVMLEVLAWGTGDPEGR